MVSRDLPRQRLGDRLDHDREGPGVGDRLGVVLDRLPAAFVAALRAKRAERVDRLRRQPDMAHHGNAALGQERDGLRHPRAAFELHRAAMGFLQYPHRGMKRLLLRGLIGAERHVDHDQRMLRTAHHRVSLQDHHVERHRHRGLETVHDIAEGIADQNDVAMAIDQRRGMRVIGRQHHDRLAVLAGADIRRGFALDGGLDRHARLQPRGRRSRPGWNAKASAR